MTTPPKAKLFRTRREESSLANNRPAGASDSAPNSKVQVSVTKRKSEPTPAPPAESAPVKPISAQAAIKNDPSLLFEQPDDGFGAMRFPGSAQPVPPEPQASPQAPQQGADMAERINAVKAENLTGRQLRMARRIASMHEIEVQSDLEAVVAMRDRGIDPFHRASVGKILSEEGARAAGAGGAMVPVPNGKRRGRGTEIVPVPPGPSNLPSREALTEDRRAAEIIRIQQDIARRRRRRLTMLFARLFVFVGIPTIIAAWYYNAVATPLYATFSTFQIQQAEQAGGAGGGLGGLFSGTQLATNTDSVSVQGYLTSRDAMMRLDQDHGFKAAFQQDSIDPILRLAPDATNEQTYSLYKNSVKIGYDPTEGVIQMEVIAPTPELSEAFATSLIGYAEEQIDQMTARLRGDQMEGAIQSYTDAENRVLQAQRRVLELQQELGVLDPAAESSVVMGRISDLERQLSEKRLELGQLLANTRPNASRVAGVEGDIQRLEEMLTQTRRQLTEGNTIRGSLASISGEIRIAESDLMTRQELLATAAAQMETARVEANKQVRYLSLSVAPVAPDEATYPKAFQNSVVAFLIFSGIYLMLSLTASILREQVSS